MKTRFQNTLQNTLFGRLGTGILTICTMVVFFAVQVITLPMALLLVMVIDSEKGGYPDNPLLLINGDGNILAISMIFNGLLLCLYLFLLLKCRRKKFRQYLALNWRQMSQNTIAQNKTTHNNTALNKISFSRLNWQAINWKNIDWQSTIICFGLWLLFVVASELVFYVFDHQPMDFIDVYVASADPLWLLLLGIIFIAPIYEELIFRGLLWHAIIEQFHSASTTTSMTMTHPSNKGQSLGSKLVKEDTVIKDGIDAGSNAENNAGIEGRRDGEVDDDIVINKESDTVKSWSTKAWLIASVITGGLFAMIHLQYDMLEMGSIFVFAIVLGYARHRSGSLFLPIAIHMANNGLAMLLYCLS